MPADEPLTRLRLSLLRADNLRSLGLMLEKTAAVFERAATDRRSWQNDLQWLKGTTADF